MDNLIENLKQWETLGLEDRRKIVVELRKHGNITKLDKKSKKINNLMCPIHKQNISTDCTLKECKFNVNYGWSKNCVLCYMNDHSKQKLCSEEISFLYQIHPEEVKSNIERAFEILKEEILKDKIDDLLRQEKIKEVKFYKNKCVVCNKPLSEDLHNDLKLPHSCGWCSRICQEKKPKDAFDAELRYGVPYETYLNLSKVFKKDKL